MSITSNQLRAARGLLNISQDELAEKTGVAVTSLRQFELGHTARLQQKTAVALMAFFASKIEFIGDRGVALRDEGMHVLEGESAVEDLFADIQSRLHQQPNEEALFLFDDDMTLESDIPKALRELDACRIRHRHLCLSSEFPDATKNPTIPTLQVVYSDTVAQRIAGTRILLVRSVVLAATTRRVFEALSRASLLIDPENDSASDSKPKPFRHKTDRT